MKHLIAVLSVFLCATMLVACGKREDGQPSKCDKIVEASTKSFESTLQSTNEEWQNGAMGFTYVFKSGRSVDCIRQGAVAITCDWRN